MLTQPRNFVFAVMLMSLLTGCDKIPFLKDKIKKPVSEKTQTMEGVVARVGNFNITKDDLNADVESYNAMVASQGVTQNKIDTREKKVAYLRNEMVRKYILYQEALDRGLDKKSSIAKTIENGKISLLVSELVRQELEKIDVSSKEVENFYNENKDSLKEPEQRKILEIVTPDEEQAKQVYIELLKGGDFAALAKQYSKGPSAANGGDLGFVAVDPDPTKRIRFDKFYEVAFASTLEQGAISNIFKGPEGFYIVKLDNIKKSEAKTMTELWDNIKSWLLFEKQQKAIADLATKLSGETKKEIFENKID